MKNKIYEPVMRKLQIQKPGRYVGGESGSIVKNKEAVNIRFAFCFPDTYEIGMSHLGMKILYGLYNSIPDVWCERCFAPWADMEQEMRSRGIPLYGLESGEPVKDFDFIGFTLQYELSYSNVLNMLELAGLPLLAAERGDTAPIVICGGPCTCNPEPLADFIDLFVLGEAEEVSLELFDLYRTHKNSGFNKAEFLKMAAQINGIYVPSLYNVEYNEDCTIKAVTAHSGAPERPSKRIVKDLNKAYYPDEFVVPFLDIVHDRAVAEVFRGCSRGCRFCQAGFIYRPVREKSPEVVNAQSKSLCDSTGYDEVSLASLSTSDYTQIQPLLNSMLEWSETEKVSISLPSLRVDGFSEELMEKLKKVRKSGLTFAPEAGTQRLRDAINKNVSEEELVKTCTTAFSGGWQGVKLYFMIGLPTETTEDVAGIAELGQKIVNLYYANPSKAKGRGVTVTLSASSFVPKPFTPFQWEPQDTMEQLEAKQRLLIESVRTKKINVNYHDSKTSFLEAVFARGDRRLGRILLLAHQKGAKFDGWSDYFKLSLWLEAFNEAGISPEFYANRRRSVDEILPWEHLDYGISKSFLVRELERTYKNQTTANCREKCAACGANVFVGGVCNGSN
ncbi:MAG: TIGR03960 family B12-binding radical SAM protein [Oscillospiraceae bacterium]|jgi:radical SAM family uncharacterized protein|nr:TIGR03960 family B12-binding radical SAM protein [Oscillospiraceae bacterium]